MARILIAGCGYVGAQLGTRLSQAGHHVWGLQRGDGSLLPGIARVRADLLQCSSLDALPRELDVVFYTAAAKEQSGDAYRAIYVEGLRNLVTALEKQGQPIQRILFTSSTAVYAQSNGEWVDETSETKPAHFTGQRLLEAENLVMQGAFPAVVLRLGGIYGPGRTQTIAAVRNGCARISDGPPIYMNHIHRDDCAGVLQHLMTLDTPEPLYVGVDSDPADRREVVRWIANKLNLPPPTVDPAPAAPPTRGAKRCRNARLIATGYEFAYPTYREGYGALIEGGAYTPDLAGAD